MIELDLWWDDAESTVVVSHGTWCGKCPCLVARPFPLSRALAKVADFVGDTTSPVILMMELNLGDNKEAQQEASLVIREELSGKLAYGKVDLTMTRPEDCVGKVLIACGGGLDPSTALFDTVNVNFRDDPKLYNRSAADVLANRETCREILATGGVMRVYPSNVVLSANFDCSPFMGMGVQFIAMNWQTDDVFLRGYKARFAGSPLIGYLPM